MNKMTIELCKQEKAALRDELHNLKSCQITFLTYSVTATGVMLGVGASLGDEPYFSIIFLLPLTVLLPSWWVFFDKATTVTRVVGYYRLLEQIILGHTIALNFVGWENALREFRLRQVQGRLNPDTKYKITKLSWPLIIVSMRTGHRYWIISYWTFFALSLVCVTLATFFFFNSIYESNNQLISIAVLIALSVCWVLLFYSIYFNARIVHELIKGRNSYDCNEQFWHVILKNPLIYPSRSSRIS